MPSASHLACNQGPGAVVADFGPLDERVRHFLCPRVFNLILFGFFFMWFHRFVAFICRIMWSDFSALLIRYLDLQTICWSTSHMRSLNDHMLAI